MDKELLNKKNNYKLIEIREPWAIFERDGKQFQVAFFGEELHISDASAEMIQKGIFPVLHTETDTVFIGETYNQFKCFMRKAKAELYFNQAFKDDK